MWVILIYDTLEEITFLRIVMMIYIIIITKIIFKKKRKVLERE